ncbi:MAG: FlgD immunoglobulin-like domain containing protein [bacterium]
MARALTALIALLALFGAGPAAAQYTLYWGNFHSHSNLSDDAAGPLSGTPGAAFQHARDVADIDVLAVTDHSHYLSASEYSSLQSQADNWTTNGTFVALAAQEHGSLSSTVSGAFGHLNVWEAAGVINQNLYRYNLAGTYAWLAANVDDTAGLPLAASFNHPYSSAGAGADAQFHDLDFDANGYGPMKFIEVLNGKRTAAYEPEYLLALGKGWHVGALGNQDNHDGSWGDQPNNVGNIPLTGIWATSLTKAAILEALNARRTYAVEVQPITDRVSLRFVADGTHWMGSEYSTAADSVQFQVEVSAETDIASIQLFRNGTFIKSIGVGGTSFTWDTFDTPGPGNFYYFVRVNQADADRAWSSPIWVESTSNFSLPISAVKENDGSGFPTLWFQNVTIQGIVTVETGALHPTDNKIFVQDASGGTMVQEFGTQTVNLQRGDNVLVTGIVDTYQGQTFLSSPSALQVLSSGAPPDPEVVTTAQADAGQEAYEGLLLEIHDVAITGGAWPAPGFDGTVTIDDGSGPLTLFIDHFTDLDEAGAPTDSTFSVRGILTQQDITPPYSCCYVLLPRDAEDIFQVEGVGVLELPTHHDATTTNLSPARPNPFSRTTRIRFEIAGDRDQPVLLAIHDVAGRLVRTLVNEPLSPGSFETEWDGRDARGAGVAAGVYFTRLVTPTQDLSRKIVRLD